MLRGKVQVFVKSRLRAYHTRECFGHRTRKQLLAPDPVHQQAGDPRLHRLIDAYRDHGHLRACLDPLGLVDPSTAPLPFPLHPRGFGLSDEGERFSGLQDLLPAFPGGSGTTRDVVEHLEHLYCDTMSLELTHLSSAEEREWLAYHYESNRDRVFSRDGKLSLARSLLKSQTFDRFLAKKFSAVKRYGAEGAEGTMAFFDEVVRECGRGDIWEVVIGMPHRGKLNAITGFLQYPKETFFHKLLGNTEFVEGAPSTGDDITHLMTSVDLEVGGGRKVHVSMLPMPAHLEAVNPLSLGKVRARQLSTGDGPYSTAPRPPAVCPPAKVLSLQVHGDASFSAQGVVTEGLGLAGLPHFDVGGSLHLIVDNQVGFTTGRDHGRSSHHCSDAVKVIGAPVIHVNGGSPEDVARAAFIAMGYRNRFQKDVLVNMTCYRRWGHNELDNPFLTQPLMYDSIQKRTSIPDAYVQKLESEGVVDEHFAERESEGYFAQLDDGLRKSAAHKPPKFHLNGRWEGMRDPSASQTLWDTGCPVDLLKFVGVQSVKVPSSNVVVNERLRKSHIAERIRKLEAGSNLDWATAEALAFGTLLHQGFNVRLCGQDVGRGTFSHRHAMFVCQDTDAAYMPLNYISPQQTAFLEVVNSPLSEEAVLGFEYGFSIESPQHLVLWEAQFGDFFTGAQIIIDNCVVSGEAKWLLQSGLVLLLPHGYDGAGPDHSSGHMERFLQQCDSSETTTDGDNVNMCVAHPTTPAQYFHLLRRQMVRNFRKPLIILSPKILLRLPAATSNIAEMGPGTALQHVITDEFADAERVQRVVFCSGKHYYALDSYRKEKDLTDIAIIRLEVLCPFPSGCLYEELSKYKNATEWVWSQEEPMNKGSWAFVQPRFAQQLGCKLSLVSRKPYAASAVGVATVHQEEVKQLISNTFSQ